MDAATLIRDARRRAGLSLAELADRAGTSAPTVSAYEHGRKRPRADVLLRLLDAAGHEVQAVPSGTATGRYVDSYCDLLAEVVRDYPGVLEPARAELDRARPSGNVDVWRALLQAGPAAVIAVLTSRDPDVAGLKADNPFGRLGLVDEDVRLALVDRAHGR